MTRRPVAPGLLVAGVAATFLLAGCGTAPPTPSQQPHAYGEPLDAGLRPTADACQRRLRSEQAGAARIRHELRIDGLSTDPIAVNAAAADPTSDMDMFGIPLTPAEARAARNVHLDSDPFTPLALWVNAGAPDRFGGSWLDGSGGYVAAVVGGDADTLALARCVEAPHTHYVWATVSKQNGQAVADQIGTDMNRWRDRGVPVNSVGYDETNGVVVVGLTTVTDALIQQFQAQYGPLVRLEVEGPITPV